MTDGAMVFAIEALPRYQWLLPLIPIGAVLGFEIALAIPVYVLKRISITAFGFATAGVFVLAIASVVWWSYVDKGEVRVTERTLTIDPRIGPTREIQVPAAAVHLGNWIQRSKFMAWRPVLVGPVLVLTDATGAEVGIASTDADLGELVATGEHDAVGYRPHAVVAWEDLRTIAAHLRVNLPEVAGAYVPAVP